MMWPVRVPTITRPAAMVGELDMAPSLFSCQSVAPVPSRYAATTPPALAATTIPPATAGVPLMAPLISTCHAALRCLAAAAVSVASAGWPSRARSPRYIGQSPPASAVGDGDVVFVLAHPTKRIRSTQAPATRRKPFRPRLLAAVNGADACRSRVTGTHPPMEKGQRSRSPPVGAAQQPHHSRHDDDANNRGVDRDCDCQADADRFDDHDVGHTEREEHRDHDCRSARNEATTFLEAQRDPGLVVACAPVLLLNPADQQHLIVH